jgi:uncharacterized protein (DUF1330 family)
MDFTEAQLDALLDGAPDRPVVMLNLVAYRGEDERDEYLAYSRGFVPLLKAVGGTILWAGDVTGVALGDDEADAWDYAVLVRYPDRQSFVDVMTSDAYAAINAHRVAGLRKHLILPVDETYSKLTG